MLKYRCILRLIFWLAVFTSIKAEGRGNLSELASIPTPALTPTPADSLVTIDTLSISDDVLVIREITHFKEVILDDTLLVGNELKIKRIIVEHTNISPIDTLYLANHIDTDADADTELEAKVATDSIDKLKPKESPPPNEIVATKENLSEKDDSTMPKSILPQTRYSSRGYFGGIEDVESSLIVAESTGVPIDVEEITKPIRRSKLSNPRPPIQKESSFTPASRAGLPGAKVLERRVITPKEAYDLTLTEIEKKRQFYARNLQKAKTQVERQEIIQTAAMYLEETIAVDVVHYWYGTSFDKEGMAKNPNEGKIACSYFITTVLEDAGLKVNRVKLAQQSAKNITKTLCSPDKMKRLTTPLEAKNYVEKNGKGLYVIGFSFHVGFLYNDGANIYLIHASPLPPGTVARLPMVGARSFDYSKFYDIGKLSDNTNLIVKWLKGERINTSY